MFSNPEQNVAHLSIEEGMCVADLGSGTGAYVKAVSKKVGRTGHVYAVEVQKDLVKKLESEIHNLGILNVDCIWGDIEKVHGTKIKDASVDRVIMSNVLFQVDDKLGLIDEAKRILKTDGEILCIDWADSFGGMGPAPHFVVTEKRALELFEKRGFKKAKTISVPDHHYGILFKR